MRFILLLGFAFNLYGAFPLVVAAKRTLSSAPGPADKALNLVLFSAGTAVVFAALYLYLFFNLQFAIPFLIFGAALKTWAFLLSGYLYSRQRTTRQTFLQFGVGNGVVAMLFWVYIFSAA